MANEVPHNEQKGYDVTETPFSWDKLDGLLAYKSSLTICSELLNTSERTIRNHIKKRFNQTFTEYGDRKLSRTKVKLVQKALEMATSGNTAMMIFCLKNLNKWADRSETLMDVTHKTVEQLIEEKKKEYVDVNFKNIKTKEVANEPQKPKRASRKKRT